MAKDEKNVNMPGAFGGIMRYNEEYTSLFNLKPSYVVGFMVLIVLIRIILPYVF